MNKFIKLTLAFSIVLILCGTVSASLNDGLVAFYPFNSNANDESNHQLHGTVLNGATFTEDRFGTSDSAYYFDGVNSNYIELPSDQVKSLLNGASAFTASVWVYNDGTGDPYRNIMRICDTGLDSRGLMFRFGASQVSGNPPNRFEVSLGTEDYQYQHISSTTDIPIGSWTHLAVVYDGATIRIYINGTAPDNVYKNTSLASNGVTQTGAVTMGTSSATISAPSTENINGKIDDVFLYDRALSPEEISQLYTATSHLDIGLAAYYPFNENANDMSGYSHHGTVHGAILLQISPTNSAYYFDGVSSNYIGIPNDPALNPKHTSSTDRSNLMTSFDIFHEKFRSRTYHIYDFSISITKQ